MLGPFIMFLLLPFDSLVVNLLGISITVLFTLLLVFIIVPAIFGVSFGIRKVYMKTLLKIFQVSHVFRIFCTEECLQCLIKRINGRRRSFYLSVGHSRQQGQELWFAVNVLVPDDLLQSSQPSAIIGLLFTGCVFFFLCGLATESSNEVVGQHSP